MAEKTMILVGCDCDPDRLRYGGAAYDVRRLQLSWRGVSDGIHLLRQALDRIRDKTGVAPKVVFCLRSDMQMKEIYGDAAWPIKEYLDLWRSLEREGHELAWHPHLWRWSNESSCWYQETQDADWINECMDTGHAAFTRWIGKSPETCHMGWTFHNDVTMRKISELGVKVDFSACPGVLYEGGPGSAGTVFDNRIDWAGTPLRWYKPSVTDYRRPAYEGESELPVVELPKFTTRSRVLKTLKDLASRVEKAPGAESAMAAFLQITSMPILYKQVIREWLACEDAGPFLITYFHPDELLAARPRSAKNFLYSLENMEKNLKSLIQAAKQRGREVTFLTGPEALEYALGLKQE